MSSTAWIGALCALYVLSWIPIAWATGVLFPGQMLEKYPVPGRVIPLTLDFYLWADLFLLSPLVAFILSEVGNRWSAGGIAFLLIVGLIAAVLFQWFVIVPGRYPSTLGGGAERIPVTFKEFREYTTFIGWLHIPFFAVVFAVIMMFLFTNVSPRTVLIVGAVFALVVPINMLVPLHFIRKWFGLAWAPNVFAEETRLYWMIGGTLIGVAMLATLKIYWASILEAFKYIGR